MNISIATGLPELPEGYSWAVSSNNSWGIYDRNTVPRVRVAICRQYEINVPVTYDFLGFMFSSRKKTVVKTHVETVHVGYVQKENSGMEKLKYEDSWVHPQDLTPDMVLETAKDVFESWETAKLAKSLLGMYPPKKLVMGEEKSDG